MATSRRWTLPAAPVTHVLRQLIGEPGFDTSEVETFARGLGLEPRVADDLLTGRLQEVTIDQVAAVCEGLHCSPYDLWGTELARTVLHTYGPERWPRYIEPLDQPDDDASVDHTFLRRRLDQRATEIVKPVLRLVNSATTPFAPAESLEVEATAYRRTAVLAWTSADGVSVVSGEAAPDSTAEYHFSFRQTTEPVRMTASTSAEEFAASPLPGFDTVPALQSLASALQERQGVEGVDLLRFVDQRTGAEQWLGWDPSVEQWQSWDDPRRYYPGDPTDVLDPGDFGPATKDLDPEPLEIGLDL